MKRLLAGAVLLAACAAAPRRAPPPSETADPHPLYTELRDRDLELRNLGLGQEAPDCRRVRALRDNICALAARICRIADTAAPGARAAAYCEDGKARCRLAEERETKLGCPNVDQPR